MNDRQSTNQSAAAPSYISRVQKALHSRKISNQTDMYKSVVNAPFCDPLESTKLGVGIIVLLLVNKKTNSIDRIALSDTEIAKGALQMTAKKFEEIKIPLDYYENILAESIRTGKPQFTDDWQYLFIPELTPEQARFNQVGAGIACSFVYPLKNESDNFGALIFSYFKRLPEIGDVQKDFMSAYADLAAKALRSSS